VDGCDAPECLRCGACCFSTLETYVRVSGDDHARLGDAAESLVRFDGHRAYMRMVDGHCAALVVDARSGRFVCSMYEARPDTCRDLARGSPACAGERETKRERPLLALASLCAAASSEPAEPRP
jgi:Fe-S-cluster containining protein